MSAWATTMSHPVCHCGGFGELRAVDLATGQRLPLGHHESWVNAVATATVEGRPVAAVAGEDATGRVWDLTTGEALGQPLIGHTAAIRTVSVTTLTSRPVVITGGDDCTIRAWDLTTGRQVGPELCFPNPIRAVATTTGGELIVCHGTEITLFAPDRADRTTR
ncbi:hypothetical protein [Streptomyces sp. NPDC048269]|uniref:WD40 repeat domain-containing protein n=1 Tax=Streptomyces sp. NPDC048269 TaxID=3155753 RepID=UPI003417C98D